MVQTGLADVVVVSSDLESGRTMTRALALERYDTHGVPDVRAAADLARSRHIDLIVIDVGASPLMGTVWCRELREHQSDVPILIVTSQDLARDEVAALDAGADVVVTKPFDLDILYARIRSLLRRSRQNSNKTWRFGEFVFDDRARTVTRKTKSISLTRREYDLFELLARHEGSVLTREFIGAHLWGAADSLRPNALEAHVASLRRKVESGTSTRLIHTVRGSGYVIRPAD